MKKTSEDQVKVQVAKCPKCSGNVKLAVLEPGEKLDKQTVKEYAKLMADGCIITTISLEDARKEKMCFLDCDKIPVSKKHLKVKTV